MTDMHEMELREGYAPIVFLAGPIRHWWPDEIWGSPEHREYTAWRDEIRSTLLRHGYLTYAPHEAFKGSWDERAQKVNDYCIEVANVMLVLSPPGIETRGTDAEVEYAHQVGTPIIYAPPSMGIDQLLQELLESYPSRPRDHS